MSKLASKLAQAFTKLGVSNGTAPPTLTPPPALKGNNAAIDAWMTKNQAAWEFGCAQQLASMADARYKAAKVNAEAAGVFTGIDKLNPGETGMLFDNQSLTIGAKINNAPSRLDKAALAVALSKAGVKRDVIEKCMAEATSAGTPAKVITCLFKE